MGSISLLFIVEDVNNIYNSNLLNIFCMLLDQGLLNFNLLSEDNELLIYRWLTKLAIHHFEDGLELIVYFSFLNVCIDDL